MASLLPYLLALLITTISAQVESGNTGFGIVNETTWPLNTGAINQLLRDAAFDAGSVNRDPVLHFTTTRGVLMINPETNDIQGLYTAGLDVISLQSIALDTPNLRGYLCGENRKVWSFQMNNLAANAVHRYTGGGTGNIEYCAFDFAAQNIYYSLSGATIAQRELHRIDIAKDATAWNGNAPSSATPGFATGPLVGVVTAQWVYYTFPDQKIVQIARAVGVTNIDINQAIVRTESVGAGSYDCIAADDHFLYVGSSLGIGLKLRQEDLSLKNVIFVPNHAFKAIVVDKAHDTLFWGTQNQEGARIVRVTSPNTNDPALEQFRIVDYAEVTDPFIRVGELAADHVFFGTSGDADRDPIILKVRVADCSLHTTCQACTGTDPQYCGWCSTTASCTRSNQCPANSFSNDFDACPVMESLAPTSGSSYGDTSIVIKTNVNVVAQASCLFVDSLGNREVPPLLIQGTNVTCKTPVKRTANSTINVSIFFNGALYTSNSQTFTYYECNGASCESCISTSARPECAWCPYSAACSSVNAPCQSDFLRPLCPTLLSVTPGSSPTTGDLAVTINATNFVPGLLYACRFGALGQLIPATRLSSTAIQCEAPASTTPGVVNVIATYNSNPYTSNSIPFLYYNCSTNLGCNACIDPLKLGCSYCFEDGVCTSEGNCGIGAPQGECGFIVDSSPKSALVASIPVVTLSHSIPLPFSTSYECKFGDTLVPAELVNGTLLICQAPDLLAGTVDLSIYESGYQYSSNVIPFLYYDCTPTTCNSCIGLVQEGCDWCLYDNSCGLKPFSCQSGEIATLCPELVDIGPNTGSSFGGTVVYIEGTNFIETDFFSCHFGQLEPTEAQRINQTHIVCASPPSVSLGSVDVEIFFNGTAYSEDVVQFTYYACEDFAQCDTCITTSDCSWCLDTQTCSPDFTCDLTRAEECPVLLSMEPNFCRPEGGNEIAVTGSRFIPRENGEYKCLFGLDATTVNANFIDNSTITCTCPPANLGTVDFSVVLVGKPYFPNALPFIYYECSEDWTDCDTCASNPVCGWCFSSQECIEEELCNVTSTWTGNSCPVVNSVYPSHSSLLGGDLLNVTGETFLNGVNIECQFLYNTADTTAVQFSSASLVSSTALSCVVPNGTLFQPSGNAELSVRQSDTEAVVDFTLVYTPLFGPNSNVHFPYAQTSLPFSFVECSPFQDCASCTTGQNNCGWCRSEMECTTASDCDAYWTTDQCPVLNDLAPLLGDPQGGLLITLTGTLFIEGVIVRFNDTEIETTFDTAEKVTAITPPGSVGEIDVSLVYKNRTFATPTKKFNYVELNPPTTGVNTTATAPFLTTSEDDNTLLITLAVALSAFCCCILLCVILFGFFAVRRRDIVSQYELKLEEPDFADYIFNDESTVQYDVSRKKAASLASLELFLLDPPTLPFIHVLANVTQATESEKLARALVFTFEGHDASIALIKSFISKEIEEAETEGSIFRAKSVASKMFKFYSKLAGLPYIWRTLAGYINEICVADLGNKYSGRLVSPNIEIEIDPNKLANPDDEQVNKLQLLLITQKVFNAIINSIQAFPPGLRIICNFIYEEVKKRFPDSEYKALGSFVFLRFLCPSITAPHAYGLLKEAPEDNAQRKLILVSKILQNLANGIKFGKKEEFMTKMNEFIENNLGKLQQFFDELVNTSELGVPPKHEVPTKVKDNSLAFLYHHITSKMSKINNEISRDDTFDSSIANRLGELQEKIGAPPPKQM